MTMTNTESPDQGEVTYEPLPEAEQAFAVEWTEPPTDTHIEVHSREADISDFLKGEQERENQRNRWINFLMQQKTQNQVQHEKALAEQEELHKHAQSKIDEQLTALGYKPVPVALGLKPLPVISDSAIAGQQGLLIRPVPQNTPARRGRPPGSGKKLASAAPTPAPATAPAGKAKRTMSQATKNKMRLAREEYWRNRRAEAKAAKKAKKAAK